METPLKIGLDGVDGQLARLWEDEAKRSTAPRIELMTVVAAASTAELADRARKAFSRLVAFHPSRTVLAVWHPGAESEITAEVSLLRAISDGPARGDLIVLDAVGGGREWLPENIDRFALPDLPVCLWWVGDLPDNDHLFERLLGCADVVVVNSREMDLRDLEALAGIAGRSRDRYALRDLSWIRLRSLQELIARFFDDEAALKSLATLSRIRIDFVPQPGKADPVGPQPALLFTWMAQALGLAIESAEWRSGEGYSEAVVGRVTVRFEPRMRSDVMPGGILGISLECSGAHFDLTRQDDPHFFKWSSEVPGVATPPQMLRVGIHEEATLLARCLDRPREDRLFEKCIALSGRAFRPVAAKATAAEPQ